MLLPTITELTAYVSSNGNLREILGIEEHTPFSLEFLARGEYNANYTLFIGEKNERHVLRINLGSQLHLDHQIEYEAHALELLGTSGRTPRVLYVDGSRTLIEHGVLVETWVPGRHLDYTTDLKLAARILADIHATPLPDSHRLISWEHQMGAILDECRVMFSTYRRWVQREVWLIEQIDAFFAVVERAVEHSLTTLSAPPQRIINTELNSENFLIHTEDESFLVDWEKPLVGDVAQDLAAFLVPTTTAWKTDVILDDEEITSFLEAYETAVSGRFDTTGLAERTRAYMAAGCLRGLTWSAMAYADHQSGVRSVADEKTFEKIGWLLSPGFIGFVGTTYMDC